jgi:esterase/lipase
MRTAACSLRNIAAGFFLAACAAPAFCAPSHAADRVGIILMHGELGAPGRVIVGLSDALEKAGYLVSRPDMCWSARRSYEARFEDCLSTVDSAIVKLTNLGATAIVVGGFGLGGNAAIAYGAGHPGLLGILAVAPGHDARKAAMRPDIVDDVGRARALVAAGKGDDEAEFHDVNIGPTGPYAAEIETTPAIYLSFFGADSPAAIEDNVAKIRAPLLWVAGPGEPDEKPGPHDVFLRAPVNALNRYAAVESGYLDAPDAAKADALAWLKQLSAR